MSYIYLASPYSHPEDHVRLERYNAACRKAASLMQAGHVVFSPIAHSHAVAAHLPPDLLMSHEFWMQQDIPLLRYADKLMVLLIDGWQDSRGVTAEIDYAVSIRKLIEYVMPGDA